MPTIARSTDITAKVPDPLLRVIAGVTITLCVLVAALYLWQGRGTAIAELPWFVPMNQGFMGLAAFSMAFLAFGRYHVLRDPALYRIGLGFASVCIGLLFYVLAWPGLAPDGRGIIAALPNTSGFVMTAMQSFFGAFLLAAAMARRPVDQQTPAGFHWLLPVTGWLAFFMLAWIIAVVYEPNLPQLVGNTGTFTPLRLGWQSALVLIFGAGAVLSIRGYRVSGDSLSGYLALTLTVMAFSQIVVIIGGKRYDLWWYLNRILATCGFLAMMFGLLSEYVRLYREERKKTRKLEESMVGLKRAEEDLLRAYDELEKRVDERTVQLMHLNRLYVVLSETNKAIVHALDRDFLFREICRIAIEHGEFRMAWIGIVEEHTGMVKPVAWSGKVEGYLDNIRISVREEPEGLGPTGSAIREGNLRISTDIMVDPRSTPWRAEAEKCGYHSSAAIALKQNGVSIGALTIYAGEKGFFVEQYTALLKQMGMELSFALDRFDLEERRRNAEKALKTEMAERIRTAEELREKDRLLALQSRQAAMGEMINNIAHQWRQPINAVGLLVQELALTYDLGEFDKVYLDGRIDKVMELLTHMSQTIDSFRNFFRLEKEKILFGVGEMIYRTVSLVEDSFYARGIEIEINAADNPLINGYPGEYSQVLINILNNARDVFSERKVKCPRISITLHEKNGKSVVAITDNGGGMEEGILCRIFEPYFTTKGPNGTGIGLYMSKTIIEKNMGGSLVVNNAEDGACFTIEV